MIAQCSPLFQLESATLRCFFAQQPRTLPPSVTTPPLVDRLETLSGAQSASAWRVSTHGRRQEESHCHFAGYVPQVPSHTRRCMQVSEVRGRSCTGNTRCGTPKVPTIVREDFRHNSLLQSLLHVIKEPLTVNVAFRRDDHNDWRRNKFIHHLPGVHHIRCSGQAVSTPTKRLIENVARFSPLLEQRPSLEQFFTGPAMKMLSPSHRSRNGSRVCTDAAPRQRHN